MNMYAIVKVFNTGKMEIQQTTIGTKEFAESQMETCLIADESNLWKKYIEESIHRNTNPSVWIEALEKYEKLCVEYKICQIGVIL